MAQAFIQPDLRSLLSFSRLTKGNRERLLDAMLAGGRPVYCGSLQSVVTPFGWVMCFHQRYGSERDSRPTLVQIRHEVADFMAGDYSVKSVSIPSMNAFELTSDTNPNERIVLTVWKLNH